MENKENEYFTKKAILERLKWLVIVICCLNVLITISLIVFFLYYNPNLLLSILSAIILGFFGTKLYKKYKK